MSRIADIATALAGYDAADLSVEAVHAFLAQLVAPAVVAQRESVTLFEALGCRRRLNFDPPGQISAGANS